MLKKELVFRKPGLTKKVKWILLLSIVLVPALTFGQTFPGKTWEKIENPEKYGFSSKKLKQMDEILKSMDTASLLVILDGKILYEYGDKEQKHFTHSARKSFMSTLYGIYAENGVIDLNKSMTDLGIDDDPPLSETEKKATILNCLMARSGVYHPSAAESASMKAIKPKRYSKKPGEYWVYNNWDFNVLYTIFEQETGKLFYEALKADIFDKIEVEYFVMEDKYLMYNEVSKHPAYHFKITARDMARFGLMMLHLGKWKNQQIISEKWVKEITSYHSDASLYGLSGYGYMWWVVNEESKTPQLPLISLKNGAYAAYGAYGQYLLIDPNQNLVVVHQVNSQIKGNSVVQGGLGYIFRNIYIAGGIEEELPVIENNILKQYLGEYELRPGINLIVSAEDNSLFVQRTGLEKGKVYPESSSVFYTIRESSIRMEFVKNPEGIVDTLVIKQLNRTIPARRIK